MDLLVAGEGLPCHASGNFKKNLELTAVLQSKKWLLVRLDDYRLSTVCLSPRGIIA